MKVVILKDVPKLGRIGDIKEVSDGFARNFLFARNLAVPATPENLRSLDRERSETKTRQEKERASFQKLAKDLQELELNFNIKVGEKGQPFGSVTREDIAEELAKKGIVINKHRLEMEHGIKGTGEHIIRIKLPNQIESVVKAIIARESGIASQAS